MPLRVAVTEGVPLKEGVPEYVPVLEGVGDLEGDRVAVLLTLGVSVGVVVSDEPELAV